MLDTKSRKLVSFLRSQGGSVCFIDEVEMPDGIYDENDEEAFWTMIHYLESKGILEWIPDSLTLRLTHTARHPVEYGWISVLQFLRDNWIAIVALIVSIIALVRPLPEDRTTAGPAEIPQAITSTSSSEISSSP